MLALEAEEMLLFLRHVEEIEIYYHVPDSLTPTLLYSCSIVAIPDARMTKTMSASLLADTLRQQRALMTRLPPDLGAISRTDMERLWYTTEKHQGQEIIKDMIGNLY